MIKKKRFLRWSKIENPNEEYEYPILAVFKHSVATYPECGTFSPVCLLLDINKNQKVTMLIKSY